jgi:dTDP-glucose 4,6-dehydratase
MVNLENFLPEDDLNSVTQKLISLRSFYRNSEVLVYGGTGFIGSWLVSALIQANIQEQMNIKIQVITRNANQARIKFGETASRYIDFIEHDFNSFKNSDDLSADIIFQGAATTSKKILQLKPNETINSILNATLHATKIKSHNRSKPMIIHLSSGAIYGKQPIDMLRRSEDSPIQLIPDTPYAKAKVQSEMFLATAYREGRITYQSPRLFAFYGPLLPMNEHFAIGNFVRDALNAGGIFIEGNASTTRSYMYPTDLISILLQLPTVKEYTDINIGSDVPITMIDLAKRISGITSESPIKILDNKLEISNYVPETKFISDKLGFDKMISLEVGLDKWINWLRNDKRYSRI